MRTCSAITLVLTALLLGTTFAHTLEALPKLDYGQEMWVVLQQTLYRYYAVIGGPVELGAILSASILAFLVRGQRMPFLAAAAGTACLAVAFFGVWLLVTRDVNAQVLAWPADSIPADWADLRLKWEASHIARFVLHLTGFVLLLVAALRVRRRG
ncbi:anthrone oxygenase family protein [uncultured Nitratireductor sp.]|uniref:anthrone oxygenase family protein n=1 Tax=uncultured Nitratireductor sp. TaxID=520953 RepID=UPI0025CE3F57|nr:anthrone oxygenase family protein [uncultured Nitratireductor sp.]